MGREPDHLRLHLLDRLEGIECRLDEILSVATTAQLEPWLSKRQLAAHLAVSTRWLDGRVAAGMPRRLIAERHKFRLSEVEPWLARHGYLFEQGEQTRSQSGGRR